MKKKIILATVLGLAFLVGVGASVYFVRQNRPQNVTTKAAGEQTCGCTPSGCSGPQRGCGQWGNENDCSRREGCSWTDNRCTGNTCDCGALCSQIDLPCNGCYTSCIPGTNPIYVYPPTCTGATCTVTVGWVFKEGWWDAHQILILDKNNTLVSNLGGCDNNDDAFCKTSKWCVGQGTVTLPACQQFNAMLKYVDACYNNDPTCGTQSQINFNTGTVCAPTCDSLALTPYSLVVSTTGETRTIVASGTGVTALTYNWTTTGGTLSSTTGQSVTWTAPTVGTTAQTWTISATATDANGQTSPVGGCTKTLSYTPPDGPACNSLTMNPSSTIISAGGETRSLTASGTVTGTLTYNWTATGGTLSSTTGSSVTWTAPANPTAATSWTISATVTDSLGRTSSVGNCTKTLTYTPAPLVACQKVMANKALDQIKDGDTVTFSGFGTLGVGDATDSIDKIKFTVYKDNVQVATADVNAFIDPTQTTATTQVYRANYDYVVSGAGTYRVVIKVHRVRGNVWLE